MLAPLVFFATSTCICGKKIQVKMHKEVTRTSFSTFACDQSIFPPFPSFRSLSQIPDEDFLPSRRPKLTSPNKLAKVRGASASAAASNAADAASIGRFRLRYDRAEERQRGSRFHGSELNAFGFDEFGGGDTETQRWKERKARIEMRMMRMRMRMMM